MTWLSHSQAPPIRAIWRVFGWAASSPGAGFAAAGRQNRSLLATLLPRVGLCIAVLPATACQERAPRAVYLLPSPAAIDAALAVGPAADSTPSQVAPLADPQPAPEQGRAALASLAAQREPTSHVTDLRLVAASVATGVTAATLAWEPVAPPAPYRIERAPAAHGPWQIVAEVGAQWWTWTDPAVPGPAAWYRVSAIRTGSSATKPLLVYAVAAAAYDAGVQQVAEAPAGTARLSGLARWPMATGVAVPLVLILPGTHGNCRGSDGVDRCISALRDEGRCPAGTAPTPSTQGLAYLADTLAARGLAAAVVDVNRFNCNGPQVAVRGRAHLLLAHLQLWQSEARGRGVLAGVAGRVDLARVGVLGHSNGGEAALLASSLLRDGLTVPDLAQVQVHAIFAVAPSDFSRAVPSDVAYGVLLPSCDTDNLGQSGRNVYDRGLPTPGLRSQIYFVGAVHNVFNAQWPDEVHYQKSGFSACAGPSKVGRRAQQGTLAATAGDWFAATLAKPGRPLPPWLRAEGPVPLGIQAAGGQPLDLRLSYAAPARLVIDDMAQGRGKGRNNLAHTLVFRDFAEASHCFGRHCDAEFGDAHAALRLTWTGGQPVATWPLGKLDARRFDAVSMRVTRRLGTAMEVARPDHPFTVRLRDSHGQHADVRTNEVEAIPFPSLLAQDQGRFHFQREILQSVRVPMARFLARNPKLDPSSLAAVELLMAAPGVQGGSLLLADLEFTEAPVALPVP